MPKIADFRHICQGPLRTVAGWRIRLYRLGSGMTVVVATELPGNVPRESIPALAETLAMEIRRLYVVPGGAMVWVEHEPGERERFDQMLFHGDGHGHAALEWKRSSRQEAEALIGEGLGDQNG